MKSPSLTQIGEIIRRVRKDKGLRLEDIADENISPATVSNLERGVSHVKQEKMFYLLDKLEISMDKLPELIIDQKEDLKRGKFNLFIIESLRDSGFPKLALEKINRLELEDQHPLAAYAYMIRGKCFNSLKKWGQAERAFFDAIRLDHNQTSYGNSSNIEAASFTGLALCSYYQNNLEQAITYTNSGLDAFIDGGERTQYKYVLLQNKAMFLEKMGRPVEALKVVQDAWEHLPEIEQVEVILGFYWLRAELLRRVKDYDTALCFAKEGLEKARLTRENARKFDLWIVTGSTYMALKRWPEAEACFEMALKMEGKFPNEEIISTAYTRLGILYLQLDRWEEARESIQKAIQIGEDSNDILRLVYALTTMGHFYQQRKDYQEAITYYKQAADFAQKHQLKNKEYIALFKLTQCLENTNEEEFLTALRNMYKVQKELYQKEDIEIDELE